jgi:hypothetical protein
MPDAMRWHHAPRRVASSNRRTPALQAGNPGAEPGRSTIWPCRLLVRTPVSHTGRAGSIPARVTNTGAVAKQRTQRSHMPPIEGASPSSVTIACEVLQAAHSARTGGASGQIRPQAPWAGRLTGRRGSRNAVIRVRFPAGPPVASSSNGQDACPSNRERGFDSRRGYHCRSSSNGQSAALRTRRLGDRTLRAAPAYRDRLMIGRLPLKQRIEV